MDSLEVLVTLFLFRDFHIVEGLSHILSLQSYRIVSIYTNSVICGFVDEHSELMRICGKGMCIYYIIVERGILQIYIPFNYADES